MGKNDFLTPKAVSFVYLHTPGLDHQTNAVTSQALCLLQMFKVLGRAHRAAGEATEKSNPLYWSLAGSSIFDPINVFLS